MSVLRALLFLAAILTINSTMAQRDPLCDVYHRVALGSSKIESLDAIGEPYNQTFEIKPEGKRSQYRFDLNKEKFVELYLTFDKDGKLNSKNIAGSYCPE
jgi:hypothetical protein